MALDGGDLGHEGWVAGWLEGVMGQGWIDRQHVYMRETEGGRKGERKKERRGGAHC